MGYETHLLIAISTFPKYGKISEETILEVSKELKKYFEDVNNSTKYYTVMFDDLDELMIEFLDYTKSVKTINFYFFGLGEEVNDNHFTIVNNGKFRKFEYEYKCNLKLSDSKYLIEPGTELYINDDEEDRELQFDEDEFLSDCWIDRINFAKLKMIAMNLVDVSNLINIPLTADDEGYITN